LELPAERAHPFAHAHDPLPSRHRTIPRRAPAVVVDLQGEIPFTVGNTHRRGCIPCMAGDVRERFLHDSERGHVDPEWKRPHLSLGHHPYLEPGRGCLRHQLVEPGERRGRGPRGRLAFLPEDVEHRSELGECLLAGLLDRSKRGASLLRKLLVHV